MGRLKFTGPMRSWVVQAAAMSYCLWVSMSHPEASSALVEPGYVIFHDYVAAYQVADRKETHLVTIFVDPASADSIFQSSSEAGSHGSETDQPLRAGTITEVLQNLGVPVKPGSVICVVPIDAEVRLGGRLTRLVDHPAFARLAGKPGLAVADFTAGKDGLITGVVRSSEQPAVFRQLIRLLGASGDGGSAPRSFTQQQIPFSGDRGRFSPGVTPPVPRFRSYTPPICNLVPLPLPIQWHESYASAYSQAERETRPLLLYFRRTEPCEACRKFDALLSDPQVENFLRYYVCARLPLDATTQEAGRQIRLLDQPAFREMLGLPGVAIVDLAHKGRPYYREVVSTFPFLNDRPYTREQLLIILTLPPGTLTQRTLIYAVRSHPERPQSADGIFDPILAAEAESHANYQARIGVQGHHFWETRFHRILSRLPLGLVPQEVCAESWPGQNLLESAIECVRCWRLSDGHWSAVARYHPFFGYDMKRGSNGVWYATGIFAKGGLFR